MAESRRREEAMAKQLLSLDIFKLDVIAREMKQVKCEAVPRRARI